VKAPNPKIAPAVNSDVILNKDGNTEDIIKAVLWGDSRPEHVSCTKDFAPTLKGSSDAQTIYNVWSYVKKNIKYILDPEGKQYIKSPAATNADGFADCKSRSVMMASLLRNLGIPYAYRFASYSGGYPVTHVYVIAKPTGGKGAFALDPDMDNFNQQKHTTYFIDKDMSEIHYVSGIGKTKPTTNTPTTKAEHMKNTPSMYMHREPSEMSNIDMTIAINRNRHEINKHIIDGKKGAGSAQAEKIKDILDAYADAAHVMSRTDLTNEQKLAGLALVVHGFKHGHYHSSKKLLGIPVLSTRNKARAHVAHHRRAALVDRSVAAVNVISGIGKHKKNPKGGFFKRLGKGLEKGLKFITHGIKSLLNAPLKLLLNVTLPKAADFFIYLFVKDPKIIAKLPDAARKKRKISEGIAQFIIHTIGMQDDHFMGLMRNGIMKKHHMSPERVLQQSLHMNISGIGNPEYVGDIYTSIINIVISIIKDIAKMFKKPVPAVADALNDPTNVPNVASDFSTLSTSARQSLGSAIAQQPIAPEEQAASDPNFSAPVSDPTPDTSSTDDGTAASTDDGTTDDGTADSSASADATAVQNTLTNTPDASTDSRKTSMC
jgi:hypothetical protein